MKKKPRIKTNFGKPLCCAVLCFFLFFIGPGSPIRGQSLQAPEVRLGLNYKLYNLDRVKKHPQRFPGLNVFVTFLVNGNVKPWLHTSYGATLTIYHKSLGNNMNPLVSDVQIDLVNTLTFGVGWGIGRNGKAVNFSETQVPYHKYLRTIHNGPAYNLRHDYEYALLFSSNFVLNNHRRNQTVGSITITTGDFSLNYYNDGAPPVTWFSLADDFDRYWTGGLNLFAHSARGHNVAEFSFDQFTGYTPLLYELATKFGMNIPEYASEQDSLKSNGADIPLGIRYQSRFSSAAYNSCAYHLSVFFNDQFSVDAGVIGSLIYGPPDNERHFGLQDIIHISGKYALHPNRDINRNYLGAFYNYSFK